MALVEAINKRGDELERDKGGRGRRKKVLWFNIDIFGHFLTFT
jgi:hypothetical protein